MIQKKIFLLITIFISIQSVFNLNAQSCYELVWNDEFNYSGLPDSTKWYFEEGGGGWGNNELQYYTSNRLENAHVEDGLLTIEAKKESYGGREYTSARLITYQTGNSWKYGKIEARIKLPYGQGIWPAFWMLGDGIFEGTSWPGCGEIDIMEMVGGGEGRDDVVYGTMHYADVNNNHAEYGGSYQLTNGIFADDFHVFAIEWTQNALTWYVDGIQYHTASLTPSYLTELHKDFFILLNIAVGGNWPGSPNSSTVFPQKMQVDYVRVYQLNNQPEISGDLFVHKAQKSITYKTLESEDFTYNWSVPADAIISSGQGTNEIQVTWGCNPGTVNCQLTTNCNSYDLSFDVQTEDVEIVGKEKVEPNAENIKFSVPEINTTAYAWTIPDDASFVENSDTNVIYINWGSTSDYVILSANTDCGTLYDSIFVEVVQQKPYPDPEVKNQIPGSIEATDYDSGGEGISYHDDEPDNLGTGPRQDEGVDTEYNDGWANIGWIKSGEWVEFTVQVESTNVYDVELRVASLNGGGQMKIYFSNEDRTGVINIPSTGSWSTFTSIYLSDIQLNDSDTLMRLKFDVGDFNISRLIFTDAATSIKTISSNLSNVIIYPNPASNILQLTNQTEVLDYRIVNLYGEIVQTGKLLPGDNINISKMQNGTYFLNMNNNQRISTLKFIKL